MAATQLGTGSFTLAGQDTQAAVHITVPANSVVESVTYNPGGAPDYEDYQDEAGAFHTRITFEKTMHTATVTIFGAAYASAAGVIDGSGGYYIESVATEYTRGPIRTVITCTALPTYSA
jgi:hypothetical protein